MTIMNDKTREIVLIILALAPLVLLAFLWSDLPDQVPMHWNSKGEVDRYGHKSHMIWLNLLLGVGMYLLFRYIPKIDPKMSKNENLKSFFPVLRLSMGLIFSIVACLIMLASAGFEFKTFRLIMITILSLFVVLGNYLPKIQSNYMVGIRTPWTLHNEQVWKKTHQLGGKLMFWTGLVSSCLALIVPMEYIFILIFIPVAGTLGAAVYSYFYYQKVKEEENKEA